MILEGFTILLPCIQTMRHQTLQQETLDSIARWEARNKSAMSSDSVADSWRSLAGVGSSGGKATSFCSSADSLLVIGALEYVLEKNPEPLRQFSALKDFSGENIAFLMCIAEWKCLPPGAKSETGDISADVLREKFTRALRIYHDFIAPRWADFPINISSVERKRLEAIFDNAARLLFGTEQIADPVCPFDPVETSSSTTELNTPRTNSFGEKVPATTTETFIDRILYWGDIPADFNLAVFNEVEQDIKYLVLTNTWPKFVKDRRGSWESKRSDSVDLKA
jgi:hypothetical protein